ncbi:hypothetical protein [Rhizobium sp. BR 315]|uniref:hypothetical protein n=1 Tax=Rhizobium sp. BR 315 TaxID=3040014 RepID=UPI003D34E935
MSVQLKFGEERWFPVNLSHPIEGREQSIRVRVVIEGEELIVDEVGDRQQDLAFTPTGLRRPTYERSEFDLKLILAVKIPVRVIIVHGWRCDVGHIRKVD